MIDRCTMKRMARGLGVVALLLCLSVAAMAQSGQRVDVPFARELNRPPFAAWLSLPNASRPVPAVVIGHTSAGVDGRTAPYRNALVAAGFAVLEIEMFKNGRRPATLDDTVPHALAAQQFLAANAAINPLKIGIMGMSWGGGLAILMASELVSPFDLRQRYAAYLGIYPVCWPFVGEAPNRTSIALGSTTGNPLLILGGTEDKYDASDDCQKVVDRVNRKKPGSASLHMYPGATHAWDNTTGSYKISDKNAFRGKGGDVPVSPQTSVTSDAVARAVTFFSAALSP